MDSPEGAVNLAKTIARQPGPPIDLNTLADLFLQRNMVREATAFLLDVLQDNDPAHDKLQTKVRAPVLARFPCPVPAHIRQSRGTSPALMSDRWPCDALPLPPAAPACC